MLRSVVVGFDPRELSAVEHDLCWQGSLGPKFCGLLDPELDTAPDLALVVSDSSRRVYSSP